MTETGSFNDQNNLPLIKDNYAQKSVIAFKSNNNNNNNNNGNGSDHNVNQKFTDYRMDIKLNGNDKMSTNAVAEKEEDPLTGRQRQFLNSNSVQKQKWRRRFASTNFFMVVFLSAYVLQGCYFTYFVSVITTIEKLFHIKSATIALLLNFTEVGQIATSLILTYYAGRGHRARWIACGMFLFSISALGSVSPHFIFGDRLYNQNQNKMIITTTTENIKNSNNLLLPNETMMMRSNANANLAADLTKLNLCLPENIFNNDTSALSCSADNNQEHDSVKTYVLVILAVSLLGIGIGQTAIATLGIPYIDDNVQSKQSALYMAITIGVRILGPAIGYYLGSLCMRISYDLTMSKNHADSDFIGAWYLGLLLVAVSMFFASLVMFTFPKNLRNKTTKVQPAPIEDGTKDNKSEEKLDVLALHVNDSRPKLKDFATTIKRQLKNDILMFRTASAVLHLLPITGLYVFLPKYLENQFHMSPTSTNWISGTFGILVMGLGIFITGVISVKFPLSARKVSLWIAFTALATAFGMFVLAFLGCPMDNYRGLSDDNSGSFGNSLRFLPPCNSTTVCGCDEKTFSPVCGSDGMNYFSACHAGCSNATFDINGKAVYNDCKCVPTEPYVIPTADGFCENEQCDTMLIIFIAVFAFTVFIHSTSEVGGMLIIMRCTHPNDKAMAMGIIQFSIGLLSNIPCPNIFGRLIDATCIVWTKYCDDNGHCLFYNSDTFRHLFFGVSCFIMLLAFIMDMIVYFKSHRIDIDPENAGIDNIKEIPNDDHGDENLLKLRKLTHEGGDDDQHTKIGM